MRRCFLGLIVFLCPFLLMAQKKSKPFPVIPNPQKVKVNKGHFVLSKDVRFLDAFKMFDNEISEFNSYLTNEYGFALHVDENLPNITPGGSFPSEITLLPKKYPIPDD